MGTRGLLFICLSHSLSVSLSLSVCCSSCFLLPACQLPHGGGCALETAACDNSDQRSAAKEGRRLLLIDRSNVRVCWSVCWFRRLGRKIDNRRIDLFGREEGVVAS